MNDDYPWHYPDVDHPASVEWPSWAEDRAYPCRTCGAPEGAACASRVPPHKPTANHKRRNPHRPRWGYE